MKPEIPQMTRRYSTVIIVALMLAVLIIVKAVLLMTLDRSGWAAVASRFTAEGLSVPPTRGSLLSDEGEVMVSSTPEYELVFKYKEDVTDKAQQADRDRMVRLNLDEYAEGLHALLPDVSAAQFRIDIKRAIDGQRNYTKLYPNRLPYNKYKDVKAFLDQRNEQYTLRLSLSCKDKHEGKALRALWLDSLDTTCDALHRIVPRQTASAFRDSILKAISDPKTPRKLIADPINHEQWQQLQQLPMFRTDERLHRNVYGFQPQRTVYRRGFTFDEVMVRKNTYGLLAARTLGQWRIDGRNGSPRNGIELAYDSLLRGKAGVKHIKKVMDQQTEFIDEEPVNGCDIVTTLNVNIQDIADKALREQMLKENADYGTAIVMETKTGYIKALVNLTLQGGEFLISNNFALNQGIETGSIFKTASILAALDDGLITLDDSVNTEPYARKFYGFAMSDDVKRVPIKKVPQILQYSSNIGTMTLIDEHYVKQGKALDFLHHLEKMGVAADHQVLPGSTRSHLATEAQIKEWKGQALWMAIGYGISVTPMNMVSFYNAIANHGTLMRPQLISEIRRDDHIVERFEPKVVVESIAGKKALNDITTCLIGVVNEQDGTGHRAQSDKFLVAGKTGTAKIQEHGEYAGRWLNFCSFFPADDPQYTCGVFVYRKAGHGGGASGGGSMSAPVVKEIAERIMAYHETAKPADLNDSTAVHTPVVKAGDERAARTVLHTLHVSDTLAVEQQPVVAGKIPDVIGMGAKDALYALESCGLRVQLSGAGRVVRQSPAADANIRQGQTVTITLK